MQRSLQVDSYQGGGRDILLQERWKSNDKTKEGEKILCKLRSLFPFF